MFGQIEQSKQQYTDKYVMLSNPEPRLKRFVGLVGQVKTVNMSGRALVEWLNYHDNIGWYDIEIEQLKVVEKPAEPTAKAAKPSAKASPAKKKAGGMSPLELLRQQGGDSTSSPKNKPTATPKPKPAGLSPLEQLRQQGAKKTTAKPTEPPSSEPSKPATAGLSPIEILRQQASKKEASTETTVSEQPSAKKPATADILAQLRSKRSDSD